MKKSLFICLSFIQFATQFACAPSGSNPAPVGTTTSPQSVVTLNQLLQVTPQTQQTRLLPLSDDTTVAYCEVSLSSTDETIKNYSGFHDFALYPLASVSKLFTEAWALDHLGADYKFEHEWRLLKNKDGTVDAYLNTNFDPIFNIEKVLYTISQLQQRFGVNSIRNLYISASTRMYLSVLNNPHAELNIVPVSSEETLGNFKLIFNSASWGQQTQQAKINVQTYFSSQGQSFSLPASFSLQNVALDTDGSIAKQFQSATVFKIESVSLFRYIKNINVNSNNYLADALFSLLGGEAEFLKFEKEKLGLDESSLIMKTGSGLSMQANGQRVDNKATCSAVLKLLHFFKLNAQKNNLDLGDLLITAGQDPDSTYETKLTFNKSVVLKTGRLYDVEALNLAGIASTGQGLMAFTFLGHDFGINDEVLMQGKRDQLLQSLLTYYIEQPFFSTLSQNEIFFVPN